MKLKKHYSPSDKKRHRMSIKLNEFTNRIKHLLVDKGMSAAQMASLAGVSRNAIHLILSGKTKPSLETAIQIASALGVPLSQLLGESSREHSLEECYRRVHRDRPSQRKT